MGLPWPRAANSPAFCASQAWLRCDYRRQGTHPSLAARPCAARMAFRRMRASGSQAIRLHPLEGEGIGGVTASRRLLARAVDLDPSRGCTSTVRSRGLPGRRRVTCSTPAASRQRYRTGRASSASAMAAASARSRLTCTASGGSRDSHQARAMPAGEADQRSPSPVARRRLRDASGRAVGLDRGLRQFHLRWRVRRRTGSCRACRRRRCPAAPRSCLRARRCCCARWCTADCWTTLAAGRRGGRGGGVGDRGLDDGCRAAVWVIARWV